MRPRRVAGVVGALVTLAGALAFVQPTLVMETPALGPTLQTLGALDVRELMLAGGGLVTLSLIAASLLPADERVVAGGESAATAFDRTVARPPESVIDAAPRTAEALDAAVDRAIAGDDAALEGVRSRLTAVAAATLADSEPGGSGEKVDAEMAGSEKADRATGAAGVSERPKRDANESGRPNDRIAAGAWTDDRTAAAFLGGPDAPDPALRARIRAWLAPERERERRIGRTLAAIERLESNVTVERPEGRS